jgi:exopolysaccharide biosynthesis predicted pyruvyltransferase EpsI
VIPHSIAEISTSEQIKTRLHQALANLNLLGECALIGYPNTGNFGDMLIWIGTVLYFLEQPQVKLNYVTTNGDFSAAEMEQKIGQGTILLQGGGNLGDLYTTLKFNESIIERYHDRPIVILPQTIYFRNQEALEQTARIFNNHPNLTLFVRDHYSFNIAQQHFPNCQIYLSPDMAFHTASLPGFTGGADPNGSVFYLRRWDAELERDLDTGINTLGQEFIVGDWVPYERKWKIGEGILLSLQRKFQRKFSGIPALMAIAAAQIYREGWQRGLSTPQEWQARRTWEKSYSYKAAFRSIDKPWTHDRALSFVHTGLYQLQQHRLVITSRLHGHIFCVLLGIPHVFLPNSYHKNKAFHETWTANIPCCRFVEDASQLKAAIRDLNEKFSA